MSRLRRPLSAIVGLGLLLASVPLLVVGWFVSGVGLSNIESLKAFLPHQSGDILLTSCNIGAVYQLSTLSDLRHSFPALKAAEGSDHVSVEIARSVVCKEQTKSPWRQVEEMRLAFRIRWRFSKDEQMAILLDSAYFGDERWGLAGASRHHFGKENPAQLDTAQIAMLVGLIHEPAYFSPANHADRCLRRRNDVLQRMKEQGSLSEAQERAAEAEPLVVEGP